MKRSASTLSREVRRNSANIAGYRVDAAQRVAMGRRRPESQGLLKEPFLLQTAFRYFKPSFDTEKSLDFACVSICVLALVRFARTANVKHFGAVSGLQIEAFVP
jgi:IS30 family transposase